MKINIHLLRSVYSFSLIKVQTELKLWNDGNRVKRISFWLIQKPECSSWSPLSTYKSDFCRFAKTVRELTAPGLDSMHVWQPKILPRHPIDFLMFS
jgi:cytosine/uracil/thiamine/allantoin permease